MPFSLASAGGGTPGTRPIVLDLLLMLLASALMAIIGKRLRLPTIASYLLTGALLAATGVISTSEAGNVGSISELALIMLMFTVGLHMDPSEISRGMVSVLSIGVIATLTTVLAILPLSATVSAESPMQTGLAIAMAMSMSSTAVVVRIMQQRRDTQRTHGRIILGTLIVQDLIALVFLAIMPALAAWAAKTTGSSQSTGMSAGFLVSMISPDMHWSARSAIAMCGIVLMIILARTVLPWLLKHAAKGRNSEIPLVLAAAAGLSCAGLAFGLGFSAELGAFLAGFMLAGTDFKHHLAGQLVPMRDLFMAVFFTSVGLQIDGKTIVENWQTLIVGVTGVLLLKSVAISLIVWLAGATAVVSVITGLALCQAGEFSIVLLNEAKRLKLIDSAGLGVCIVGITLLLTPALYELGFRLGPWANSIKPAGWKRLKILSEPSGDPAAASRNAHGPAAHAHGESPHEQLAGYVIIAGFGVVGRSLADRFDLNDVPYCIVDMNQATINTQRKLGRQAIYGDISNAEVLESAGIHRADAVMLTIPDDDATLRACQTVREHHKQVFIAARTSFLSRAMQAMQLGADMVVVEEVATAEAMAKQVIDALGRRAQHRHAKAGEQKHAPADSHASPGVNHPSP